MDKPFLELVDMARNVTDRGGTIFQKFTCVHCRTRQTMSEPNTIYTKGECEECGGTTDLQVYGGGLVVIFTSATLEEGISALVREERHNGHG